MKNQKKYKRLFLRIIPAIQRHLAFIPNEEVTKYRLIQIITTITFIHV